MLSIATRSRKAASFRASFCRSLSGVTLQGLEVAESEGAGRGLFATRNWDAGEVMLVEVPLVYWQHPSARGKSCLYCHSPLVAGAGLYCSDRCSAASSAHVYTGIDTSELEAYCVSTQSYEALRVLHVLVDSLTSEHGVEGFWAKFGDLARLPREGEAGDDGRKWAMIRKAVGPVVEGDTAWLFDTFFPPPAYDMVAGALLVNHFNFRADGPTSSPRGAGENATTDTGFLQVPHHALLFHAMSMLNHSCTANAAVRFPITDGDGMALRGDDLPPGTLRSGTGFGAAAQLVATRDIAAGEEVSVAYVDPSLPWFERQRLLMRGWGFLEAEHAEAYVELVTKRGQGSEGGGEELPRAGAAE